MSSCHHKGCTKAASLKCNLCGLAHYCGSSDKGHQKAYQTHVQTACISARLRSLDDPGEGYRGTPLSAGLSGLGGDFETLGGFLNFIKKVLLQYQALRETYFGVNYTKMANYLRERADVLALPLEEQMKELLAKFAQAVAIPKKEGRPKRDAAPEDINPVFQYEPYTNPKDGTEEVDDVYRRWNRYVQTQNVGFSELGDQILDRQRKRITLRRYREAIDANLFVLSSDSVRKEHLRRLAKYVEDLNTLVGMDSVKNDVARLLWNLMLQGELLLSREFFFNFAITGPAGTGKTQLAKKLGPILHMLGLAPVFTNTIVTSVNQWVASYEGQTATKTANQFLNGLGGVVLIDEAYLMVPPPEQEKKGFGLEAVGQIVALMEEYRGLSIIMLAGYKDDIEKRLYVANEGIPRRIEYSYDIQPYSADEIGEIIRRQVQYDRFGNIELDRVFMRENWMDETDTGHNLRVAHSLDVFSSINGGAAQKILRYAIDLSAQDKYYHFLREGTAQSKTIVTDDILSKAVIMFTRQYASADKMEGVYIDPAPGKRPIEEQEEEHEEGNKIRVQPKRGAKSKKRR